MVKDSLSDATSQELMLPSSNVITAPIWVLVRRRHRHHIGFCFWFQGVESGCIFLSCRT